MGFRVESTDLDKMIGQFDALAKGGPRAAAERMDAHLWAGYEATQARLAPHFETGRTAASGSVSSEFTGSEWHGRVEYGVHGPEGEHATGAQWLLANGDDYLAPLDTTAEQVGRELDAYFSEALE